MTEHPQRRRLAILGSTGSIGRAALEVVRALDARYVVTTLVAGSNWQTLLEQVRAFRPKVVALADAAAAEKLRAELPDGEMRLLSGEEGVIAAAVDPESDMVLSAIVGAALNHPTWQMGPKITVDSATLMNKALEIIEAHWLFGLELEQIDLLIHPESIVHSLVEFVDGSVIAQMGTPDMRAPIQYALTWPDRVECPVPRLRLSEVGALHFEEPDVERFPAIALAYDAARRAGTAPAALNAGNEIAVEASLDGRLRFTDIAVVAGETMNVHRFVATPSLDDVLAADRESRDAARRLVDERTT